MPPIFMKFGTPGHLADVITCVKFLVDRFRGYLVLTPPKLPFPMDLLRRPYNSVHTAVRHCDWCHHEGHLAKAGPILQDKPRLTSGLESLSAPCDKLCFQVQILNQKQHQSYRLTSKISLFVNVLKTT